MAVQHRRYHALPTEGIRTLGVFRGTRGGGRVGWAAGRLGGGGPRSAWGHACRRGAGRRTHGSRDDNKGVASEVKLQPAAPGKRRSRQRQARSR